MFRYFGPPGTGKTTTLINQVEKALGAGVLPNQIGFFSFTRKAAEEARDRAAKKFNLDPKELPFFRTLHSFSLAMSDIRAEQVMQKEHYRELSEIMGFNLSVEKRVSFDEDVPSIVKSNDPVLGVINLARLRKIDLREQYNQTELEQSWNTVNYVAKSLLEYKKQNEVFDFTDMLEQFVIGAEHYCPRFALTFLDEAQDLSALQWDIAHALDAKSERMYCAGDDDQAIMGFQGADPSAFLEATEEKEVLQQSYRLPFEPWQEAQRIVSRIEGRQPKKWQPKEEEGVVRYHQDLYDVPIAEGEWCIMARTNRIASHYANALMDEGWVFSRNGHPSIQAKTYEAILDWEQWCKNGQIGGQQLRNIYTLMSVNVGFTRGYGPRSKALLGIDPETFITMSQAEQSYGLLAKRNMRWHQALDKIDPDTKNYILNALKRGDNIKNPRIKINTIHGMKGGECDNILVIPDLSHAAYKQYQRNPNMEHRVYYVAVTRTKNSLHIMEPVTDAYYSL